MVWFVALMLLALLAWALWPLVSLRQYRGREGEPQFVSLEYSGLPVAVDLTAIPSARSSRSSRVRPASLALRRAVRPRGRTT
jgi:hypothetical protein